PASRTHRLPAGEAGAAPALLEATLDNLGETFRHVPRQQVSAIVERLADRRGQLYLIGGRFTGPIARYMAAHLAIVRRDVWHLSGQESLWRDRLIDMGKRDTLIVFDIRRYQEGLVQFAEKAH